MAFPKMLYVREDENNDPTEDSIIIADRSIEEVMDGDNEQEIAEYKLVKVRKASKVVKVT